MSHFRNEIRIRKYKCFDIYAYDYIYKVHENNVLKILFSALVGTLRCVLIIEYNFHFEEFLSVRCFLWFLGNNPEECSSHLLLGGSLKSSLEFSAQRLVHAQYVYVLKSSWN
jgi:hypothetical protein